jgi:hypothetical protein
MLRNACIDALGQDQLSSLSECFEAYDVSARIETTNTQGLHTSIINKSSAGIVRPNGSSRYKLIKLMNLLRPKQFFSTLLGIAETVAVAQGGKILATFICLEKTLKSMADWFFIELSREEAYIVLCVYQMSKSKLIIVENELLPLP